MKAFFLSRNLNEKLLLAVFVLVAALIWLSSVTTRAGAFWRGFRRTSSDLEEQRLVLSQEKEIAARARAAIQIFEASKTIDLTRLPGEVNAIANAAGVPNVQINNGSSQASGQFSLNSVQVIVRGITYDKLLDFYRELSNRAPYISTEQVTIRANPGAAAQLLLTMKVSSVAVNPAAPQ